MLSGRPGLGLSVAVGFSVVLVMGWLAASQSTVFAVVMIILGLTLVSGFAYTLILALRGRLTTDPATRNLIGLWRWTSLGAFRSGWRWPLRSVRKSLRLGRGSEARWRRGLANLAKPVQIGRAHV